jgi:hypothetical protein
MICEKLWWWNWCLIEFNGLVDAEAMTQLASWFAGHVVANFVLQIDIMPYLVTMGTLTSHTADPAIVASACCNGGWLKPALKTVRAAEHPPMGPGHRDCDACFRQMCILLHVQAECLAYILEGRPQRCLLKWSWAAMYPCYMTHCCDPSLIIWFTSLFIQYIVQLSLDQ